MFDKSMEINQKGKGGLNASGYSTAMTLFDGSTWLPSQNLWTDQVRTEYRNQFCKDKTFHKATLRESMHLLPRKKLVYDIEDNNKGNQNRKSMVNVSSLLTSNLRIGGAK